MRDSRGARLVRGISPGTTSEGGRLTDSYKHVALNVSALGLPSREVLATLGEHFSIGGLAFGLPYGEALYVSLRSTLHVGP